MIEEKDHNNLVKMVDKNLVDKAYTKLAEIVSNNFENAMNEAGTYLLETFYDNDIELARQKKSPKEGTLNQLIKRLQERSPGSPSKSWVYQSIGLVVQNCDIEKLEKESFQTYGNLLLSHKIKLLNVKKIEDKEKLINEIKTKNLSVRKLEKLKKELKIISSRSAGVLSILRDPEKAASEDNKDLIAYKTLKSLPVKKLDQIKKRANEKSEELKTGLGKLEKEIKKQKEYIKKYNQIMGNVEKVLETKK